jgi:hypothetical protein
MYNYEFNLHKVSSFVTSDLDIVTDIYSLHGYFGIVLV